MSSVLYRDNGLKLTENDCIRVIGSSSKQQEYTNVFRAILTAVTINAKSIEKVDCISVINPAKKTVFVGETQEQGGGTCKSIQGRILRQEHQSICDHYKPKGQQRRSSFL